MVVSGNILAIDTTFAACSAAVRLAHSTDHAKTFSRYIDISSGHAEYLMGIVDSVLAEANITFADLNALAVTSGPGSFTGIRVGISAVRGLSLATGLPVYAASSLAVIARGSMTHLQPDKAGEATAPVAICVDARRGQIYFQILSRCYQKTLIPLQIGAPSDVAEAISTADGPFFLVRSHGLNIAAIFEAHGIALEQELDAALPSAEHLLDADLKLVTKPEPLYLRSPDAKAQSGKALARRVD